MVQPRPLYDCLSLNTLNIIQPQITLHRKHLTHCDTIWWHRSGSASTQVMAWCHQAFGPIMTYHQWVLWHSCGSNFLGNTHDMNLRDKFQSYVFKLPPRGSYVNRLHITTNMFANTTLKFNTIFNLTAIFNITATQYVWLPWPTKIAWDSFITISFIFPLIWNLDNFYFRKYTIISYENRYGFI